MRRLLLLALPLALIACGDSETAQDGPDATTEAAGVADAGSSATVRFLPLGESTIEGTATFTETDEGLLVEYDLTGLEVGEHGFHVHENGDCGPGDDGAMGGAAGGHFNPFDAPHGPREGDRTARHVGDLGNVESTAGGVTGGVASGQFVDSLISLDGPTSIVGRAMMVHLKADDLESQPSGDAGDRIGCGVIELVAASETTSGE